MFQPVLCTGSADEQSCSSACGTTRGGIARAHAGLPPPVSHYREPFPVSTAPACGDPLLRDAPGHASSLALDAHALPLLRRDQWCELMRRAWCASGDWLFPPVFILLMTGLCYIPMPFWLRSIILCASLVGGLAVTRNLVAGKL